MKDFFDVIWKLAVLVLLLLILVAIEEANAAESDSLYFVSATDMIAQVDSVIGVCDTVKTTYEGADSVRYDSFLWHEQYDVCFARYFFGADTLISFHSEYPSLRFIVTKVFCRELIAVVVVKPLKWVEDWSYYADTLSVGFYQGQMVVWWREVER